MLKYKLECSLKRHLAWKVSNLQRWRRNKQELSFSHQLGARCKDGCYIHRLLLFWLSMSTNLLLVHEIETVAGGMIRLLCRRRCRRHFHRCRHPARRRYFLGGRRRRGSRRRTLRRRTRRHRVVRGNAPRLPVLKGRGWDALSLKYKGVYKGTITSRDRWI